MMAMASMCLIVPPNYPFVGVGTTSSMGHKLHNKEHLHEYIFWLQISSEENAHNPPPPPVTFSCLCFFCMLVSAQCWRTTTHICVFECSPNPFQLFAMTWSLMFGVVWCKTTIIKLCKSFQVNISLTKHPHSPWLFMFLLSI